MQQLLDMIAGPESGGNYNIAYGGTPLPQGATLGQIMDWQRQHGRRTGSSAVGRYQIIGDTMEGLVDQMGLSKDTPFTPALQDAMAVQLLKGRGLDAYLQGKKSPEAFAHSLAQEWAALPAGPHNLSYHHGDEMGNKAGMSWEEVMNVLGGDPSIVANYDPVGRYRNSLQGDHGATERYAGLDQSMAAAQGMDPQGAQGQAPADDMQSQLYKALTGMLDQYNQPSKKLSPLTLLLGAGVGAALGGGWQGALAGMAGTVQAHKAKQPSDELRLQLLQAGVDLSNLQFQTEDRRISRKHAATTERIMGPDGYSYFKETGLTPEQRREYGIANDEREYALAQEQAAANAPPPDHGPALERLDEDLRQDVDLGVVSLHDARKEQRERYEYRVKRSDELWKDYSNQVKPFVTVLEMADRLEAIPLSDVMDENNKSIDQEIITVWNKMLRPLEAVMADDVAVALGATRGWLESKAQAVRSGQALTPAERLQYLERIEQLSNMAAGRFNKVRGEYEHVLSRTPGVDREMVFRSEPPEFGGLGALRERREQAELNAARKEIEARINAAPPPATQAAPAGPAEQGIGARFLDFVPPWFGG